ncbi:MAG TPA: ABC transporter ATP-binding protein [Gaiella sp.]
MSDLDVRLPTEDGDVHAVRGLSFGVRAGEVLAIVGESGSGKSAASLAILGLLPKTAVVSGSVTLNGRQLIGMRDADLAELRGRSLAMVLQDPMTSLNPVLRIGAQLGEAVLAHQSLPRDAVRERCEELLETVGLTDARRRLAQYPHELSGGMRQRVVIAMAMANRPDVIIADEPTTALDVTIQAQVLETLKLAHARLGSAMVLITHDLGVVAGIADRVLVMYAGRAIEIGGVDDVYYRPRMPYTVGLLTSSPRLDDDDQQLVPIPGRPPSPMSLPPGCTFHPRCPIADERCRVDEPVLRPIAGTEQEAACHYAETVTTEIFRAKPRPTARELGEGTPVLRVEHLSKRFPLRGQGVLRRVVGETVAADDVSFELRSHETVGLVGESGSGKSTVARMIMRLIPATSGSVWLGGTELDRLDGRQLRAARRDIQIVFQDPFASLDPRMPIRTVIGEPMRIHGTWKRGGPQRVAELLNLVGLEPAHANRYPHEFSGGQRQRIGIARALALEPKVLVLDEPVSALDVSVQAGVLNLLEDLRQRLGLAYLFIAHDLSVVRRIADRVAVMYLGAIVELAETRELFGRPAHPYTQALLSAVPTPDPATERRRRRVILTGDVNTSSAAVTGCRFRPRCPKFATELSREEQQLCIDRSPSLEARSVGHPAACHYAAVLDVVNSQAAVPPQRRYP